MAEEKDVTIETLGKLALKRARKRVFERPFLVRQAQPYADIPVGGLSGMADVIVPARDGSMMVSSASHRARASDKFCSRANRSPTLRRLQPPPPPPPLVVGRRTRSSRRGRQQRRIQMCA